MKTCFGKYNSSSLECHVCFEDLDCVLSCGETLPLTHVRIAEKICLQKFLKRGLIKAICKYAHTTSGEGAYTSQRTLYGLRSLSGYKEYIETQGALNTVPYGLRCTAPFILAYALSRRYGRLRMVMHSFHSYEFALLVSLPGKFIIPHRDWWSDLWVDFFTTPQKPESLCFTPKSFGYTPSIKKLPSQIASEIRGILSTYKDNSLVMASLIEALTRSTGGKFIEWYGGDERSIVPTLEECITDLYTLTGSLKDRFIRNISLGQCKNHVNYTIYPSIGEFIGRVLFGNTISSSHIEFVVDTKWPLIYMWCTPYDLESLLLSIDKFDFQPLLYRGEQQLLIRRKRRLVKNEKKRSEEV